MSQIPRDGERLQGAWAAPAGRRPAVLFVCGTHFAIRFADGINYMGNFELDTKGRPRAMVMRIVEGPAKHKGQTALGFYEFDGEHLRWCTAGPRRTDRPIGFPSPDDPDYLFLMFRREPQVETRRG